MIYVYFDIVRHVLLYLFLHICNPVLLSLGLYSRLWSLIYIYMETVSFCLRSMLSYSPRIGKERKGEERRGEDERG